MFVPVGEAAYHSLERLVDELVEMANKLPEGETKRRMTAKIHKLEELLMAWEPL